jgi:dienelactone hydrolase
MMLRIKGLPALLLLFAAGGGAEAEDKSPLQEDLAREIIGPRQSQIDVREYVEARLPRLPAVKTAAEWEEQAKRLRKEVLEKVVFRGEAAAWRDAKTKVEFLDVITTGPGYKIKKLRYEALPGLWIPALLYEPEKLSGKVPVSLAVNGHEAVGKSVAYKQIRCINMAKRGMLVLNVEWFGMGQLRTEGFAHAKMNQLDLCGTGGIAPFYLAMTRGLDVLLAQPNADPERVAVSGLSGGGWQTIFVSALDVRVTLANPVAGYSAFRTRLEHGKDLGDSEQTPCDLATVADYTHLTALRAPRPTLLTYNSKDQCCFESGYALPPLREAALPIFKLYGKEKALRWHVNDDPGTHNFEKDNRQALYRMIGDFFYAGDAKYNADEIPCEKEVKNKEELTVELPADNADFNKLALTLAKTLPRDGALPDNKEAALKWQQARRAKLREIVRAKEHVVKAVAVATAEKDGRKTTWWKLRLDDAWTVPVVELVRGEPKGTAILLNDAGRKADPVNAERLLKEGYRVLAVDPFYFGEARVQERDYLFALMLATIGERPLGLQASEVAAVARWSRGEHKNGPVTIVAVGPRTSTIALVAAGLEEKAIGRLELDGALGSLKEILEKNRGVDQMPELFCFGLLEAFDVKQLAALAAPLPVVVVRPSDRAKTELAGLKAWYATLGGDFDPLR